MFEGGRLLQILSLRRGANSRRGAYLKLGANSSIYGKIKRCLFNTQIHSRSVSSRNAPCVEERCVTTQRTAVEQTIKKPFTLTILIYYEFGFIFFCLFVLIVFFFLFVLFCFAFLVFIFYFYKRVTVTRILSRKVCYISEMDTTLTAPGKLKADLTRVGNLKIIVSGDQYAADKYTNS